jgi:hypothetical protein
VKLDDSDRRMLICISNDAFMRPSGELRVVNSIFGGNSLNDFVTGLYTGNCYSAITVNVHAVVAGNIWGNDRLKSSIFTSTPFLRSNKYISSDFEPFCHSRASFFASTILYVKFKKHVYVDGHEAIYSVMSKIFPFPALCNFMYYHCNFNELFLHASVLFLYKHGGILELGYSRFPVHIITIGDLVLWVVTTLVNDDDSTEYCSYWIVASTGQPLFVREKSRIVGYALGSGVAFVHVYMTQVIGLRACDDLLLLPNSDLEFSTLFSIRMGLGDKTYHGVVYSFHHIAWCLLRSLMHSILLYEDHAGVYADKNHPVVTAEHPLLKESLLRFNHCIWVLVRLICWLCPTDPGIVNASIIPGALSAPHVKRALDGSTRIDILCVGAGAKFRGVNEALINDGFPFCVYRTEESGMIAIFTLGDVCVSNKKIFGPSSPPSSLSVAALRVAHIIPGGSAHYDKYMNLRIRGSPRVGDIFSLMPRARDLPDGRIELYDALNICKRYVSPLDCKALLENLDKPPPPLVIRPRYFEKVRSHAFEVFMASRKHKYSEI